MRNAYRAFRASIIESFEPPRRPYLGYPFEEPHPLQQLRQQITAFREHLAFHGERMLSQDLELEPRYVRHCAYHRTCRCCRRELRNFSSA